MPGCPVAISVAMRTVPPLLPSPGGRKPVAGHGEAVAGRDREAGRRKHGGRIGSGAAGVSKATSAVTRWRSTALTSNSG